jgi:AbrB family looped-hinge helix DNA binding protein
MTTFPSATRELRVARRGQITLPKALRDNYRIHEGDALTLVDLGGVFVLSPRRSEIDRMADEVAEELAAKGESLASMLDAVREARAIYEVDREDPPGAGEQDGT